MERQEDERDGMKLLMGILFNRKERKDRREEGSGWMGWMRMRNPFADGKERGVEDGE
jgi:hypothetical protein